MSACLFVRSLVCRLLLGKIAKIIIYDKERVNGGTNYYQIVHVIQKYSQIKERLAQPIHNHTPEQKLSNYSSFLSTENRVLSTFPITSGFMQQRQR